MVNENESEGKPDILSEVASSFDELRDGYRDLANERENVEEAWERLKAAREEFRLEKSAAADAVRQAELARGEAKLGAMLRGQAGSEASRPSGAPVMSWERFNALSIEEQEKVSPAQRRAIYANHRVRGR